MAETKKRDLRAFNNNFGVSDFTLGRFDHKAEVGTTKADLLKPEYWSHVSELMTPWSEITVRCVDGTFYAKFLVLDCSRGYAKVQNILWINCTTADVAETQSSAGKEGDYDVLYKGVNRKWVVQRKADQVVIKEGETSKAGAQAWLETFLVQKVAVDPAAAVTQE